MKRLLTASFVSLLLLPQPVRALPLPLRLPDADAVGMQGVTVMPQRFDFRALQRVSQLPWAGTIREGHGEGVWEEAELELERQKKDPKGPDLAALGAHLTLDTTPAGKSDFAPLAPAIGTGFEGIMQGGYIPSEPTVAAGPLNVFSTGNVNVTVTNKDGSSRVETSGAAFFGVTAGEGTIFDAQCCYDALRGRFVAVALTEGTSPANFSSLYLVVSQTNDARGLWWRYKFDMAMDGSTPSANWSDYESVGITDDKLVFTAQQFTFATSAYRYPKVRVIDRAAVYAGQPVSYVDFVGLTTPLGGDAGDTFVTKCARNLSAGDSTAHLLCVRTNGGSNVTYREIVGPAASPVITTSSLVPVAAYTAPPGAVQKGSAATVATNDCRPGDFVVRNGVLVVSWHHGATIGGTSVSAVRLLRLRTSDLAVLTDETFGAASTYYFYPAATVDAAGTVYIGFGRSSSAEYPSAYASARRPSDASIEPSTLLKSGVSATAQSRWGDYTGIDNDAALSGPSGTSAWYAGQWTKGLNSFGTWMNRLSLPYGQVGGSVADDCDGSALTTGDRSALANATVTLVQGATTVATTTTDAAGAYNFGYLEAGTYDVLVTPPAGGSAVDAVAGTGGNSQVRIGAGDVQVAVTTAQASSGNNFAVTTVHALPASAGLAPNFTLTGSPGLSLAVTGSGFTRCSSVRVDGADRPTTYVDAGHLTATLPAGDLVAAGARAITVFTPAPGGGSSGPQYLTVGATPDTQAPVVTVTSPAGGENWSVGSTHAVTWTAADNVVVATVDLSLSLDGGVTFPVSLATGIPNSGTWSWPVPFTPSATARVRVTAHDGVGNAGADSSHANFTIAGWTVTASAGANGAISPSGATVVADGATPAFTITPAVGYHVLDVLVNGISQGAVTNYTFPAIHANQSIAASFAINSYTLNVGVLGSGTVTKVPDQPTYDYGTLVTLTAAPSGGTTFAGWTGDTTASANPLTLVMNASRTLSARFGLHVYVWNQAGTAGWPPAANWTPTRTTPATDDVLLFNGGGTPIVTNVPTQTIGQLIISNGTRVALEPANTATVTITGGAGADLDLAAGAGLALDGAAPLTLALATGATGAIAGPVAITANAHRLTATDAGALVFRSGSSLSLGTGFLGTVFGTGTGISGLNSVVFQSGSLLAQTEGGTPFGALAPNSAVVFQPGSRYRLDGPLTPQMANRTYGDFEYNAAGAVSPTGMTPFTMDSLIVSQGTLNLNVEAGGTIRGSIRVRPGATLGFNPALGTPTYRFSGSAAQQVAVFGSFGNTTNAGFAVNNANGVTLATSWQLAGALTFQNGRITTGANLLSLTSTGSVTGASQGTGWVAGNLRRNFAAGSSTRTLDVGDPTTYSPVTVAVTGAGAAFDLAASAQAGDHPSLASSDLDPVKVVHRTWTLAPAGSPVFTSADATFGFAAGDIGAGANTANFVVRRYSGGWTSPATGARTATSTQATGLAAFGDFAVGETGSDLVSPLVTLVSPNGGESLVRDMVVPLTWTASDNVGVTAIDLLLSRTGSAGTFDTLAAGIANTGTHDWTVTIPTTTDGWLKVIAHDAAGNTASDLSDAAFTILATTGIEDGPVTAFALSPVLPNPTHGGGRMSFALPRAARVHLSMLDVQGREVLVLANGEYVAGRHSVSFGARAPIAAGLYFVRLRVANGPTFTRRLAVAR
jgi:hypothetical protein